MDKMEISKGNETYHTVAFVKIGKISEDIIKLRYFAGYTLVI